MSYSNGIGDWKQALNPIAPASAPETRQVKATKTGSPGSTQVDQAKLSPASELIAQALGGSDVRSEKVEALRQAIASGTYNISSSDVADKWMQSLLG